MNKDNKKGFIKSIILIVVALIILGYLGYDARNIIESESVQSNLAYTWALMVSVWENYLQRPALYLWNDVFVDNILDFFIDSTEVDVENTNLVDVEIATST